MTTVRVLLVVWAAGSVGLVWGWWRLARTPSVDDRIAEAIALTSDRPPTGPEDHPGWPPRRVRDGWEW